MSCSIHLNDIWNVETVGRNKAIKLLFKIFNKIISNPSEPKYGDLNFTKIRPKFDQCKPAFYLLFDAGFKQSTNGLRLQWIYNDENYELLKKVNDLLQKQFNNPHSLGVTGKKENKSEINDSNPMSNDINVNMKKKAVEKLPDAQTWSCSVCTYFNPLHIGRCQMCNGPCTEEYEKYESLFGAIGITEDIVAWIVKFKSLNISKKDLHAIIEYLKYGQYDAVKMRQDMMGREHSQLLNFFCRKTECGEQLFDIFDDIVCAQKVGACFCGRKVSKDTRGQAFFCTVCGSYDDDKTADFYLCSPWEECSFFKWTKNGYWICGACKYYIDQNMEDDTLKNLYSDKYIFDKLMMTINILS